MSAIRCIWVYVALRLLSLIHLFGEGTTNTRDDYLVSIISYYSCPYRGVEGGECSENVESESFVKVLIFIDLYPKGSDYHAKSVLLKPFFTKQC